MSQHDSRLIEVRAIIVAYAMSRLDRKLLDEFGYHTWNDAFTSIGHTLGVSPASMKHLRDEFDPIHGYRKGWHQRRMRPNRQRVLADYSGVSDYALIEVVRSIVRLGSQADEELILPIAEASARVENVAARLRTGRLAEEYFMKHSKMICGIDPDALMDHRLNASGYDFASALNMNQAIEVKGLAKKSGQLLFTDLEYQTAKSKASDYLLVVVGNLESSPSFSTISDPANCMQMSLISRQQLTVGWRTKTSVA